MFVVDLDLGLDTLGLLVLLNQFEIQVLLVLISKTLERKWSSGRVLGGERSKLLPFCDDCQVSIL